MKRNRFAYITALLIAIIFVYSTEKDTAYVMLYVLISMPVISFFYSFFAIKSLSVRQFFRSSAITAGDESEIIVMVENRGFFPAFDTELMFSKPEPGVSMPEVLYVRSIPGRSVRELVANYSCKYRGQYTFGVDCIKSFDALKLFKFKKIMRPNDFVVVYPRTLPINPFPVKAELTMKEDAKKASVVDDYYTVADIRKHVPTDSLKRVHWKLSAKKNELLVKKHQASGNSSVIAVLDMAKLPVEGEEAVAIEDKIMSKVLSVFKHLTDRRIWTDLLYASDSINTFNCASGKDLQMLKPILAKAKFDSQIPTENILRKLLKSKDEMGNIVIFTTAISDMLCQNAFDARKLGHNVILVYFNYITPDNDKIYDLQAGGINCIVIVDIVDGDERVGEVNKIA